MTEHHGGLKASAQTVLDNSYILHQQGVTELSGAQKDGAASENNMDVLPKTTTKLKGQADLKLAKIEFLMNRRVLGDRFR